MGYNIKDVYILNEMLYCLFTLKMIDGHEMSVLLADTRRFILWKEKATFNYD